MEEGMGAAATPKVRVRKGLLISPTCASSTDTIISRNRDFGEMDDAAAAGPYACTHPSTQLSESGWAPTQKLNFCKSKLVLDSISDTLVPEELRNVFACLPGQAATLGCVPSGKRAGCLTFSMPL